MKLMPYIILASIGLFLIVSLCNDDSMINKYLDKKIQKDTRISEINVYYNGSYELCARGTNFDPGIPDLSFTQFHVSGKKYMVCVPTSKWLRTVSLDLQGVKKQSMAEFLQNCREGEYYSSGQKVKYRITRWFNIFRLKSTNIGSYNCDERPALIAEITN